MLPTIIQAIAGPISGLLSEFIEDKDKRNEISYKIASQAHELAKGQLEVNKVEAAHKSIFVAGWRPAVGWICALSMGFNYLAIPMLAALGTVVPPVDDSSMMTVLLGMLGLGGMRTFEKHKGVSREK